jgi:uncharacterized protein (DUF697 family)
MHRRVHSTIASSARAWKTLLRKACEGGFDGASDVEKDRAVEETIRRSSSVAAILALQPVPFLDTPLVNRIQDEMIGGIGQVRGFATKISSREIRKALSARLIAPHLSMAGAKLIPLVPVVPDLVAASIAYALTYSVGKVSDEFFRDGPPPTTDAIGTRFDVAYRNMFKLTFKQKRNELKLMLRRNPEVRQELAELRRAQRDHSVGIEDAARKMEEIVNRAEQPH